MALLSNFGGVGVFASMMITLLVHLPYQVISTSRTASTVEGFLGGLCASSVHIHGYKCQEFQVSTDDGYILSMQRIPPHRSSSVVGSDGPKTSRLSPPVLLQHGLLVDGMTWLLNSPGQSLAFILADSGFDVWISNIRGTRFSRRHVTLNANINPEFWDWTWDDLIMNDLPAVINFIFKQTGQKLHYVGHSLGTLMALASFSSGNEKQVVDKVKSAALLSPIAYLSHMTTAFGVVAARSFVGEVHI
ncbi:hypothetical protein Leryth_021644 [Lithospermum erythrorhizon]|nr:hypothetical protein Leryth_021644 [Lithospermum erythrorhizon]